MPMSYGLQICSCLFDLEYHITVLDGEPCVVCPKVGGYSMILKDCPKCGHAEEDKGMTVEEAKMGWSSFALVAAIAGVREHPPQEPIPRQMRHCGREQDFQQIRSGGYREYFKCKCGEEWDAARCPESCPRCGSDPDVDSAGIPHRTRLFLFVAL